MISLKELQGKEWNDLTFKELLKRSFKKAQTITENQKQLPDANRNDSRT